MVDVHDKKTRSRNMAAVRGKNTKPELLIRKGLFRRGFRYRLHYGALPGRPDIVLPKHRAVVQVHGCFWHGHQCQLFQWPASRKKFWNQKISKNQVRDASVERDLQESGWRVLTIWECALRGACAIPLEEVLATTEKWLRGTKRTGAISGRPVLRKTIIGRE